MPIRRYCERPRAALFLWLNQFLTLISPRRLSAIPLIPRTRGAHRSSLGEISCRPRELVGSDEFGIIAKATVDYPTETRMLPLTEIPSVRLSRPPKAVVETGPAVSVSLLTYNQRELVGRAIDSILAQRVDFEYEIIIGDDCSDDGTQEVLRAYRDKYPDRIHLILHPRRYDNVPGRINNLTNLRACRGKYTAMLDGDDYWTDPDKLQRQYDRMEAHPELSMCAHDVTFSYAEELRGAARRFARVSERGRVRASGVFEHRHVAAADHLSLHIGSLFFRTGIQGEFPGWFHDILPADYALMLLISQRGPVYYDARPQAVYTRDGSGFCADMYAQPRYLERRIRDAEVFATHFPAIRRQRTPLRSTAWMHYRLARHHFKEARWVPMCKAGWRMLRADATFPATLLKNAAAGLVNRGTADRPSGEPTALPAT